jgi:hypothetical protein
MRARPQRRPAIVLATLAAIVCPIAALAAEGDGPGSGAKPAAREEPAAVGPADFAILITVHVTAAEMNCPYRIEEGRLRRLLRHHGLTLGDAYTASRSRQLKAEVDKLMEGFRADRQKACDIAWKHFGPGATFEGYLQPR